MTLVSREAPCARRVSLDAACQPQKLKPVPRHCKQLRTSPQRVFATPPCDPRQSQQMLHKSAIAGKGRFPKCSVNVKAKMPAVKLAQTVSYT